jgi:hypothetical protein
LRYMLFMIREKDEAGMRNIKETRATEREKRQERHKQGKETRRLERQRDGGHNERK